MYSTCLFCNKALATNDVIEHFRVGRRLAFDGEKGRLWVICRRCERWNLTPLEERWEAIEECERNFRSTRIRTSTENIGLAKLAEGTELIRIGAPLRPEFAAWRYGDQFGRRRRRTMVTAAASVAALGAVVAGAAAAGVSVALFAANWSNLLQIYTRNRVVSRIQDDDGITRVIRAKHLDRSRLIPQHHASAWALDLHYGSGGMVLSGPDAVAATSRLMARVNRAGGSRKVVEAAVRRIETAGDPTRYFLEATREADSLRRTKASGDHKKLARTRAGSLTTIPHDARLALEMATQEEAERRALEDDLTILEAAWRQADEIAHISDNLLVPESAQEFIERHRTSET
jgi:hypothetical protein